MKRPGLLLVLLALVILPSADVQAASGGTAVLPLPQPAPPGGRKPKPNPRALSIKIDTTWVDCNGYRPVRVTITPKPPLAADRTITLRFRPGGWGGMHTRMSLTQDVELPAGATSVATIMAVPQLEAWNTFAFDVFDDGVPVEEFSVGMHRLTINANNTQWGDGSSPNVLLLGAPKLPGNLLQPFTRGDESIIQVGLPPATIMQGAVRTPIKAAANPFAGMSGISSHADLPTRWIDYSGLDIIYVELPELETFVQENPQQWEAIRKWLAAGGNLWVGKVGARWENIGPLEKLLQIQTSEEGDPPGWLRPDPQKRYQMLLGFNHAHTNSPAETPPSRKPLETPLFRTRSVGRGQVMAFGHDDPLTEIQHGESWNWIYNTAGPERWSWYRRHGISLQQANPEFWEFLIPGVGLAPVTEFQVLITLFVLGIGPLNYYLLRRWQKLNLIMITVPVSALAITGALLLYALVADGLGVRTRARSFTEIDQRRGEAVCWARLSYYAGLRPSQGLSFPTDVAVYPIEHASHDNYYGRAKDRREIDWRQTQDLGTGWLNARTPTQLLTVSSRPARHQLQVTESSASSPTVKNLLGTRIMQLILVDSQGRLFAGQDLAEGAKSTLTPSTRPQAASEWAQIYNGNRPQRPPGMSGNSYSPFGISRNYSYYNQAHTMDSATLHTSILERSLVELAGSRNPVLSQPRTYVALVDRSPEVSFGLKSVQEEDSFHVILGRW